MSATLTADLTAFRASLRKVSAATKKEYPDIVNKALKDVGFRAASFTDKADPAKIEQDLWRDKIGLKLAARTLKQQSGQVGGKRVTRRLIALRTKQLIARRKKVVGYARAGWFAAIRAFGGTIRGSGGGRKVSPPAKLGFGTIATAGKLWGEIVNLVYDKMKGKASAQSRAKMEAALHKAIVFVTKDREEYAQRKIDAILKRNSD